MFLKKFLIFSERIMVNSSTFEKKKENESNIIRDGKNLLILGTFLSIKKKKINTNQQEFVNFVVTSILNIKT